MLRSTVLTNACMRLIEHAIQKGATGASARTSNSEQFEVSMRAGELDKCSVSEAVGAQLAVLVDGRCARVHTTSLHRDDLERAAEEAVAMAREVSPDESLEITPKELWACDPRDVSVRAKALECDDEARRPSVVSLKRRARALSRAAGAYPGVSRVESAGVSWSRSRVARAISTGFSGLVNTSSHSKGVEVIAEKDGEMKAGSKGYTARFLDDLASDEECAQKAGERAVLHLGATQTKTAVLPVVFDRDVGYVIPSTLFSAINATRVYQRQTFLVEALHTEIFPRDVTIVDDPYVRRGLGSRLYDSECVGMLTRPLVLDGKLMEWVSDLKAARKLGRMPTGHASGPSNLTLLPGSISRADLLRGISRGLLVTSMFGHGANIMTGAYSVGVEGFMIENGEVARPVNGITIAGDLRTMFQNLRVTSDMSDRSTVNAPTCYVGEMTVGGT